MRLDEYLSLKKMTKTKFASLVGVNRAHISNICNGKRNPSVPLVKLIEKYTDGQVTIHDLQHAETSLKFKVKKEV